MRKLMLATIVIAFLAGGIITSLVMASDGEPSVEERYNKVERGCLACHAEYTQYSLNNTARYSCYLSSDCTPGTHADLNETNDNLQTCQECHDEDMTVGEAKPLSDIVHSGHMYSKIFLGEGNFTGYHSGNCFSCHDINAQTGQYKVLYEKVNTSLKGVPNSSYYQDMESPQTQLKNRILQMIVQYINLGQ